MQVWRKVALSQACSTLWSDPVQVKTSNTGAEAPASALLHSSSSPPMTSEGFQNQASPPSVGKTLVPKHHKVCCMTALPQQHGWRLCRQTKTIPGLRASPERGSRSAGQSCGRSRTGRWRIASTPEQPHCTPPPEAPSSGGSAAPCKIRIQGLGFRIGYVSGFRDPHQVCVQPHELVGFELCQWLSVRSVGRGSNARPLNGCICIRASVADIYWTSLAHHLPLPSFKSHKHLAMRGTAQHSV